MDGSENGCDHSPHDSRTHDLLAVALVDVSEGQRPEQVFLALVGRVACTSLAAGRKDVVASEVVGYATSDDLLISSFSLNWTVHHLDDKEFLHFYF